MKAVPYIVGNRRVMLGRSVFDTDRRVLVEVYFLRCYLGVCKGDRPGILARAAGGTDDNGRAGVSIQADEGLSLSFIFLFRSFAFSPENGKHNLSYHVDVVRCLPHFSGKSPRGKLPLIDREVKMGCLPPPFAACWWHFQTAISTRLGENWSPR